MRLMIALASKRKEGPVDLGEIARREGISMKYLSQIILPLKNAGLVVSYRGARGGYALARQPEEITPRDIYEAIDGPIIFMDCLTDAADCDRTGSCAASILWGRLREAVSLTMSSMTLKQLVEQGRIRQNKSYTYTI
jgi:Rrf2 family protein